MTTDNNRRLLGFVSAAVTNRILLSVIMRKGWIYNRARDSPSDSIFRSTNRCVDDDRLAVIDHCTTHASGNRNLIAALHKVRLASAKHLNHFYRSDDVPLFPIILREMGTFVAE